MHRLYLALISVPAACGAAELEFVNLQDKVSFSASTRRAQIHLKAEGGEITGVKGVITAISDGKGPIPQGSIAVKPKCGEKLQKDQACEVDLEIPPSAPSPKDWQVKGYFEAKDGAPRLDFHFTATTYGARMALGQPSPIRLRVSRASPWSTADKEQTVGYKLVAGYEPAANALIDLWQTKDDATIKVPGGEIKVELDPRSTALKVTTKVPSDVKEATGKLLLGGPFPEGAEEFDVIILVKDAMHWALLAVLLGQCLSFLTTGRKHFAFSASAITLVLTLLVSYQLIESADAWGTISDYLLALLGGFAAAEAARGLSRLPGSWRGATAP